MLYNWYTIEIVNKSKGGSLKTNEKNKVLRRLVKKRRKKHKLQYQEWKRTTLWILLIIKIIKRHYI